jgi:cytochrome c
MKSIYYFWIEKIRKMKKITYTFLTVACFFFLTSCGKKTETDPMGNSVKEATTVQTPEELGKEIFEGKGTCATCHKADAKVIGPSLKEISKIYKDKKASIALFLKGEGEPLVDPSQYEVMKANFAITKTLSDEELDALEAYIHSLNK